MLYPRFTPYSLLNLVENYENSRTTHLLVKSKSYSQDCEGKAFNVHYKIAYKWVKLVLSNSISG